MSVAKIIEIISEGKTIDEAVKAAVIEASKTISNIKQADVKHIQALVENNKVVKFRVDVKISFIVEHASQ